MSPERQKSACTIYLTKRYVYFFDRLQPRLGCHDRPTPLPRQQRKLTQPTPLPLSFALPRFHPQVPVEPLSVSETLHVAKARYPGLPPPALKRMLGTMVAAKSGDGGFGFASRSAAGREPGVRDLLKLCARVDTLGVFDRRDEDEVKSEFSAVGGWFTWKK